MSETKYITFSLFLYTLQEFRENGIDPTSKHDYSIRSGSIYTQPGLGGQ